MRRLIVNSAVVAAMLATEFALRHRGVSFGARVIAMGVVSAVLLVVFNGWQRGGRGE
jgi:hypothetical protein